MVETFHRINKERQYTIKILRGATALTVKDQIMITNIEANQYRDYKSQCLCPGMVANCFYLLLGVETKMQYMSDNKNPTTLSTVTPVR